MGDLPCLSAADHDTPSWFSVITHPTTHGEQVFAFDGCKQLVLKERISRGGGRGEWIRILRPLVHPMPPMFAGAA